jgi:hypothetical protein
MKKIIKRERNIKKKETYRVVSNKREAKQKVESNMIQ